LRKGIMKIVDKAGEAKYIPVSSGFAGIRSGSEARFLVEEETDVRRDHAKGGIGEKRFPI